MKAFNPAAVKFSFAILLSILVSIGQFAEASFSGSYTVDSKSPASSNSYTSIAAVISDLSKGTRPDGGSTNGPGISGNVYIRLAKGSGPYQEQIVIPLINGVSSTQQLVFDGNGEMIAFMPSQYLSYVVKFDGASFISFQDFTIEYQGKTGGRNIQISNHCRDVRIEGCTLTQPENERLNYSTAFIALTTSNDLLDALGVPGERITITKNTLSNSQKRGVYCGVYLGYHADSSIEAKTEISHNLIEDFSVFAISSQNAVDLTIEDNEIRNNFGTSTSMNGMWIYLKDRPIGLRIKNNYLHDFKHSSSSAFSGIELDIAESVGGQELSISGNRLIFDSITGSGTGIHIYHNKSSANSNIRITKNHIQFHAPESGSKYYMGIYNYADGANKLNSLKMEANKIDIVCGGSATGVYQYFTNTVLSQPIAVYNNILSIRGTNTTYVFRVQGSANQKYEIYHNTMSTEDYTLSAPQGTGHYLFYGYESDFDMKNNLFFAEVNKGNLTGLQFGGSGKITCDYNSIYIKNNGPGTQTYSSGSTHGYMPTFNDLYQKMSGGNDINLDPLFKDIAACDFIPTEKYVFDYGTPLLFVRTDINGSARSKTTPDMGAIEVGSLNENLVDNSSSGFKIYPNPAKTLIQIQTDFQDLNWSVSVLSSSGKLLVERDVHGGINLIDLDVSHLSAGVYLVTCSSGNRRLVRRVVIGN